MFGVSTQSPNQHQTIPNNLQPNDWLTEKHMRMMRYYTIQNSTNEIIQLSSAYLRPEDIVQRTKLLALVILEEINNVIIEEQAKDTQILNSLNQRKPNPRTTTSTMHVHTHSLMTTTTSPTEPVLLELSDQVDSKSIPDEKRPDIAIPPRNPSFASYPTSQVNLVKAFPENLSYQNFNNLKTEPNPYVRDTPVGPNMFDAFFSKMNHGNNIPRDTLNDGHKEMLDYRANTNYPMQSQYSGNDGMQKESVASLFGKQNAQKPTGYPYNPNILPSNPSLNPNKAAAFQQVKKESSPPRDSDTSPKEGSPKRLNDDDDFGRLMARKRRTRKAKNPASNPNSRVCEYCNTSQTPEWRKGPNGETLCNACGLQYRKLLKERSKEGTSESD